MNCGSSNDTNHIKIDAWKDKLLLQWTYSLPPVAFPADVIMTSRICYFVSQLRVVNDHQTNAMLIQFNEDSP